MWKIGGPPLPPILARAYTRYYVYTHSLVILALVLLIIAALGRRRLL